jgi:hypothetical protein
MNKLIGMLFVATMLGGCANQAPVVHGPLVGSSHGTYFDTHNTQVRGNFTPHRPTAHGGEF